MADNAALESFKGIESETDDLGLGPCETSELDHEVVREFLGGSFWRWSCHIRENHPDHIETRQNLRNHSGGRVRCHSQYREDHVEDGGALGDLEDESPLGVVVVEHDEL